MEAPALNYRTLSGLTPGELAVSLRKAIASSSKDSITSFLLEAVECDGIPPAVFRVWLGVAKDPKPISLAINSKSRSVRHAAYDRFGKWLRGEHWRILWETTMGGVQGILDLLQILSVEDVLLLLRAIRFGAKIGEDAEEKRDKFTLLFQGLLPQLFPDALYKTRDDRQLSGIYLKLLSMCSASFVDNFIKRMKDSDTLSKVVTDKRLVQTFPKIFQELVLSEVPRQNMSVFVREYLAPLLEDTPPLPSPRRDRFSAPMDFSIQILEAVANVPDSNSSDAALLHRLVPGVMGPLVRRMIKRKVPLEIQAQVYKLILQVASKHESIARNQWLTSTQYVAGCSPFRSFVLRAWERNPEMFQEILKTMFNIVAHNVPYDLENSAGLLAVVHNHQRRYELLNLIGSMACKPPVNIEDVDSLRQVARKEWTYSLFFDLGKQHGYNLLSRLMQTASDRLKIKPSYSGLESYPDTFEGRFMDVFLLRNMLADDQEALEVGNQKVEEKKKMAVRSRDQAERAFYAKGAIIYSISSRDLTLFEATLKWSRRFLRDPLTVKSLFARDVMNTSEVMALLSGISSFSTIHKDSIRPRIQQGNRVMMMMLDFACSALREPSFAANDWASMLGLFERVGCNRLKGSRALQKHFDLTDKEMDDLVWDDTLSTMISAERTVLKPEYKALGYHTMQGLLGTSTVPLVHKDSYCTASARFLDNLAKARNDLWTRKRILDDPAVSVLPSPWPQGLAIQHLLPFSTHKLAADSQMPYMMSRARSVVLMDRNIACSAIQDEDIRKTIGYFSDDYSYALRWFVNFESSKNKSQKDRISVAWSHVIQNFVGSNQPLDETIKIWQTVFSGVLGDQFDLGSADKLKAEESVDYEVVIPEDADDQLQNEWDPAANEPDQPEDVSIERNLILNIAYDGGPFRIDSKSSSKPIIIAAAVVRRTWNLERILHSSRASGKNLEGLLLSALLYLNTKSGGPVRILSEAFPTQMNSKRFPPLFLANEFLSQKPDAGVNEWTAERILATFLPRVPPSLLLTVAQGVLEVLVSTDKDLPNAVTLENTFYGLARLLVQSDKPEIAYNILCEAILNRPDSSSWHRHIMNIGFLKRLSSDGASNFVQTFAQRVADLSRAQKSRAADQSQGDQLLKGPFVKVTTIKLLAQLLVRDDIFPLTSAIAMLEDILVNQSHIDIRAAALQSILSLLENTSPEELNDSMLAHVHDFLTGLVPIIGGFSERRIPSEDIWTEFLERNELPYIDHEQPMYSLLMQAAKTARLFSHNKVSVLKDLGEIISRKVLLPAIRSSISLNREWLANFNKKHRLGLDISTWPVPTPNLSTLGEFLLEFLEWVPLELFKLYNDYIVFTLQPPQGLKEANQDIMNNPELRNSAAGRHWLQVFSGSTQVYPSSAFTFYKAIHHREWSKPPVEGGVRVEDFQDAAVFRAKTTLVSELENPVSNWWSFANEFSGESRFTDSKSVRANLELVADPILRRIIADVDALRTPKWQVDLRRYPTRLPSTFLPRLKLLRFPIGADDEELEQLYEDFATKITAAVDEIISMPTYHKNFELLKVRMNICSKTGGPVVACILGTIPDGATATTKLLLHLELAEHIFQLTKDAPKEDIKLRSRACVASWENSYIEEAREYAGHLLRDIKWLRPQELDSKREYQR